MTTITLPRAVVEQALEALAAMTTARCGGDDGMDISPINAAYDKAESAITALRAALAQQAEPTGKKSLQVESVVAENATTQQQIEQTPPSDYRRGYWAGFAIGKREGRIEAEDELAQQAEPVEPVAWSGYDLDGMVEAFSRVIESHYQRANPFQNPIDMDAQMALRILRGFIPAMKAYTAPPQRKLLTDEEIERICASLGFAQLSPVEVARAVERAHGIGDNK